MKNRVITVQDIVISISREKMDDYICITDLAKAKTGSSRSADIVKNWLRNRTTLEFLGTWEQIYNYTLLRNFRGLRKKKRIGISQSGMQKDF